MQRWTGFLAGARAYGALAAIVMLVFWPVLDGRVVFMRDPAHWTFPIRWYMRESLFAGRWPAWDPAQGLGFPLVADPLLGLFYPLNWVYLLPDPARMLAWDSLLHLILGGAGVIAALRRLGASGSAALVGGVAWSLSGVAVGMWTAGLLLQAMAWIPWTACAGLHLAQVALGPFEGRRALRAVLWASLPTGLALLQGEVFLATMGVGFALFLGLAYWDARRATAEAAGDARPPLVAFLRRFLVLGAAAVLLAALLAAANLLPVRAAAAETVRARPLPLAEAEIWSLHPLRVLELVVPGVFGRGEAARIIGDERQQLDLLGGPYYLGIAVVLLAAVALGRRQRLAGWLCLLAGLALLVSLGRFSPVHAVVRWCVPPLAFMRYPEKYVALIAPALALMAGLGAARLASEGRRPWGRTLALVGLLALLAIGHRLFPREISAFVVGGSIRAVIVVGLATAAIAARSRRAAAGSWALLAVVALDLATSVWSNVEYTSTEIAYRRPPAATYILEHRAHPAVRPRIFHHPQILASVRRRVPVRNLEEDESLALLTLVPNMANVYGLASLPGYDAAIPASWSRFWDSQAPRRLVPTLRLAGAEFAVMPLRNPTDPPPADGLAPTGLDPLPGARLYRVVAPLPRVYAVGKTEPAPEGRLEARLLEEDVLSGHVALVEPEDGGALLEGPRGPAGACDIERHEPGAVAARCALDRPALVVLVEQSAPGWTARVDGAPVPIHRVNRFMRGVKMSGGTHRLEMTYEPPGLKTGLVISVLALATLLAGLWLTRGAPPR